MQSQPLYRARDGMILGVCRGLARYRDLPLWVVRLVALLLILCTGFWPGVALYFLAAFLMEPEPAVTPRDAGESAFFQRFQGSRNAAMQDLQDLMDRLDKRLRVLEDKVTRPAFDWEARVRKP